MKTWKRRFHSRFPELWQLLRRFGDPYPLWINLQTELFSAYDAQPVDESFVRRVYEYAEWCLSQIQNQNLVSAVCVCFYEHLPLQPSVRSDVSRWLSGDTFKMLQERKVFAYHLDAQDEAEFIGEFYGKLPYESAEIA